MANIKRKILNIWDGGIKTSDRDSSSETSSGAQMIRGFDIYKDPKKMVPMQSWEDFTTSEEKAYNILAMGGASSTVYGLGSALENWYGADWNYRIKVNVNKILCRQSSGPMHLNMALLPNDFWNHIQSDGGDIRVSNSSGVGQSVFCENVDTSAHTGDMWLAPGVVESTIPTLTTIISKTSQNASVAITNTSSGYALAHPVTFTGQAINHIAFKVGKSGLPGDLTVKLYTDNAGVPGTLVSTLGTVSSARIAGDPVGIQDAVLNFTAFTLTGNYHIVYTSNSASTDDSNYWYIFSSNSGTETIQHATNIGLTSWSVDDSSATPYYVFSYYDDTAIPEKYFYIYYGNATVDNLQYGNSTFSMNQGGREIFANASLRFAYTFGDSKYDNKYYSDFEGTGEESFTTKPHTYVASGLFGKDIKTFGDITTDYHDNVTLTGSDISFSFTIFTNTYDNVTLIRDIAGTWSVGLTNLGKITFSVNGTAGSFTMTSTLSIPLNQEVVVDCVYDNDYYIYIHGVQQRSIDNNSNYDDYSPDNGVIINTGNYVRIGQVWGYNNDNTIDSIFTKLHNFTNSNFFTIGNEESLSSINKTYTGTQLYYKVIGSNDGWKEKLEGGRPVKSLTVFPVNAFIDDTGTYFIVKQNNAEGSAGGFRFIAKRDFQSVCDFNNILLDVEFDSSKLIIQPEVAIDSVQYFNGLYNQVSKSTDSSVFTAPAGIESLVAWRTYLAVGYNYRNNGFLQLWNLVADTQAAEKVNVGTGTLRIVGNAQDVLFSVTDNFIDDAIKSGNKPTMEIRRYIGNGTARTTHVIKVPKVITEYDDIWERAISNFKIKRNTQTLFYARLPKDSTGETFNEGFWSVGLNSNDELALALQIDTSGLGLPKNVFAFAQQAFFIAKDGGIHRLSDDTYNNIALYTTMKMNEGNTEQEKKLCGIEITTEPLDPEQIITIYLKTESDAVRRKVLEFTGENLMSYESTYDFDGLNLPNYHEIEFDIESTKGGSAPLELLYKYEYLSDVV